MTDKSKRRAQKYVDSLKRATRERQAERLKEAQVTLGINEAEMAQRLDIDFETYNSWLMGENFPTDEANHAVQIMVCKHLSRSEQHV